MITCKGFEKLKVCYQNQLVEMNGMSTALKEKKGAIGYSFLHWIGLKNHINSDHLVENVTKWPPCKLSTFIKYPFKSILLKVSHPASSCKRCPLDINNIHEKTKGEHCLSTKCTFFFI